MTEAGPKARHLPGACRSVPFTIEASARVLDDIRLAVTDAFFLPAPRRRGNRRHPARHVRQRRRLIITDHAALDCEHAYGPSFTLSPPDEERLTQLLAAHDDAPAARVPWDGITPIRAAKSFCPMPIWRSTSATFPESWQVALVMKPHTFQPARIGFFFREADGSVHAVASYREDTLDALPVRQVPTEPARPPRLPPNDPPRAALRQYPASAPSPPSKSSSVTRTAAVRRRPRAASVRHGRCTSADAVPVAPNSPATRSVGARTVAPALSAPSFLIGKPGRRPQLDGRRNWLRGRFWESAARPSASGRCGCRGCS